MRLEWSLLARGDREAIFDYLEPRNPRAAIETDARIEAAGDLLRRFPLMGRSGRVETTREWVVSRTPYVMIYQAGADTVTILRVLHGKRRWP